MGSCSIELRGASKVYLGFADNGALYELNRALAEEMIEEYVKFYEALRCRSGGERRMNMKTITLENQFRQADREAAADECKNQRGAA